MPTKRKPKKMISMDLNELIQEHKELTRLLRSVTTKLTTEYIKQSEELKDYKKKYKGGGVNKVKIVMREFKDGQLHDWAGRVVHNPKQAIAIALSEQKRYNKGK